MKKSELKAENELLKKRVEWVQASVKNMLKWDLSMGSRMALHSVQAVLDGGFDNLMDKGE